MDEFKVKARAWCLLCCINIYILMKYVINEKRILEKQHYNQMSYMVLIVKYHVKVILEKSSDIQSTYYES
jgi:hypothetical protein